VTKMPEGDSLITLNLKPEHYVPGSDMHSYRWITLNYV
jgi:hypothetical protein